MTRQVDMDSAQPGKGLSCPDCLHYHAGPGPTGGTCRRNPPVVVIGDSRRYWRWPAVERGDWCAQLVPRGAHGEVLCVCCGGRGWVVKEDHMRKAYALFKAGKPLLSEGLYDSARLAAEVMDSDRMYGREVYVGHIWIYDQVGEVPGIDCGRRDAGGRGLPLEHSDR